MINPFSFRPGQVTFWTTVTYLALLIPIIVINEQTPPAPSNEAPVEGVNFTQAWLDLTTITKGYHPYNSRYNDELREYFLQRIHTILDDNRVTWMTDGAETDNTDAAVTVFDDMTSNCTFLMASGVVPNPTTPQVAAYFEGTNILVYIRGKQDDEGNWWKTAGAHDTNRNEKGLTLVNAHYDSVSTGYGATDDGMGVVTCLQLLQHFTHSSHQPEHGILILLNNGEEDYLYGARALGQHPLNPYIHTFLNLEGAGAGGRAILFRSTDREVTAAYAGSPDPFGTVIGSDAFGLGFIRSGTDYSVLYDIFGQRGLDLAFFRPRARYHTNQDDARHASRGSLWHMLSAALHTTRKLSGNTGETFIGPRPDGARGKVHNGRASDGVWFDLFGKGFVLFGLRGMFAWSLTVLVATPLILVLVTYLLHRADKYYLFSSAVKVGGEQADEGEALTVPLGGWKGFFRFPFALLMAGSLTLGAAFLMRKVNPFVIYGNRYTVLTMMVSLFYFTFWAIMRGADFARPSALHRIYVQIWLFILGWTMLVAVTVAEDRLRIGAGYMFVFLQSALFLSLFIALCEMFALPRKSDWAQKLREAEEERSLYRDHPHDDLSSSGLPPPIPHHESTSPTIPAAPNQTTTTNDDEADPEPTERTPLVGGAANGTSPTRTTFATTYRRSISALVNGARRYSGSSSASSTDHKPFEHEQPWSGRLPTWTWLPQFLLLGPFTIVLVGQTALMLVDAVHQTGADGSSLLLPYLLAFMCTVLLILPLAPFVHRVTHHVPVALGVVFVGVLVWNLVVFPFGAGERYKVYFVQRVEIGEGSSGNNTVCYNGVEDSVPPRLVNEGDDYAGLVTVNATRTAGNAARIRLAANNTKACFLEFDRPVTGLRVHGSSEWDDRFGQFPEAGVKSLRLWHRKWEGEWVVDVEWKDSAPARTPLMEDGQTGVLRDGELRKREDKERGLEGTVVCMWSDANVPGTIPAFDEAVQYAPAWVAVTKFAEGLVEGRKRFRV
ncbi:hypothetical protein N0V88_002216 [Collariella sp. IMI 366227]|nr:hypothetical protein N0V88_002216 [Collariella sp. IMI 366227]